MVFIFNKVTPVFVPSLSREVLYAFQVPQSNGLVIYDLDSLKDKEFNIEKSLSWCLADGTKKVEEFSHPVQFAYPANKETFELITKIQMFLNDNWKINWHLGEVESIWYGFVIIHKVIYKFINEDTIECIDLKTFKTFFTSYKSLKV